MEVSTVVFIHRYTGMKEAFEKEKETLMEALRTGACAQYKLEKQLWIWLFGEKTAFHASSPCEFHRAFKPRCDNCKGVIHWWMKCKSLCRWCSQDHLCGEFTK